MAFALALQFKHDFPGANSRTILTTTAIVVLTVLLIGGSTGTMLEALDIVGDSPDLPLGQGFESNNGCTAPPYEEGTSTRNMLKMKLKEIKKSAGEVSETSSYWNTEGTADQLTAREA